MATTTKDIEKQSTKKAAPKFASADSMPPPRRGRRATDTTEFEELIGDLKPHALLNVEDKNTKERWSRTLRNAAKKIDMEVETAYEPDEQRLYFRGYPIGKAPARGRRTQSNSSSKKSTSKK